MNLAPLKKNPTNQYAADAAARFVYEIQCYSLLKRLAWFYISYFYISQFDLGYFFFFRGRYLDHAPIYITKSYCECSHDVSPFHAKCSCFVSLIAELTSRFEAFYITSLSPQFALFHGVFQNDSTSLPKMSLSGYIVGFAGFVS